MKSDILWSEKIRDGYDKVISPDGEEILVAANDEIRVYSAKNGLLLQNLQVHKDAVTCIEYSNEGQRFASGSLDKQVIIWTNKFESILKYSHNDVIQCLKYNPRNNILASCSTLDFGLWTLEQKSVSKYKVPNAINACSWSSDGQSLALGYVSGIISIRNRNGDEKQRIDKGTSAPIWTLTFCINKQIEEESIVVIDFDQKMFLLDSNGKLYNEKFIGFNAKFIAQFQETEFLIAGGSNNSVDLLNSDGLHIYSLTEPQSSWVRNACCHPFLNHLTIVTHEGRLAVYEFELRELFDVHLDRYVSRETMTDVVIQHLISDEKVRIKCHSLVKNVAIYKKRLAIQLTERVIIYELSNEASDLEMHYKIRARLQLKIDCKKILVFSQHLLIFQSKRIQCFRFNETLEREWFLDSEPEVMISVGGLMGRESCLIGFADGQVWQLFIHNQFPVILIKLNSSIVDIQLSAFRTYLAVTDTQSNCCVYFFATEKLLYQELNANHVAWNSHFDEMLCYSGNESITIKSGEMTTYHQQIKGKVIAFIGCKVYLLKDGKVEWIEITQSVPMYQYMERKQFDKAYNVACLSVTEYDWEQLAQAALQALELDIALKSFQKLGSYAFIQLLHRFLTAHKSNSYAVSSTSSAEQLSLLGDVAAYRGQFSNAARLYVQAGHHDKAAAMYSDLRMFEAAQELLRNCGVRPDERTLAAQKARWAAQLAEQPRAAAELAIQSGDWPRALRLAEQIEAVDLLLLASRQMDKAQHVQLNTCALLLLKYGQTAAAAEVYKRIGDFEKLAGVWCSAGEWSKAFALLKTHPHVREHVLMPYATYLAERGEFVQAQAAFYEAGQLRLALRVLQQLSASAIAQQRFQEAAYFSWILSRQCLELVNEPSTANRRRALFERFTQLHAQADMYFAYELLHRYVQQPFTAHLPDALFNAGRYLLHRLADRSDSLAPLGVSRALALYALAKQSRALGAYKFARMLYEQLFTLQIPENLKEQAELGHLLVRCKPFNDAEELLPLCYRCSTTNPLFNMKGNQCVNCEEPFYFSFASFDSLPLIRLKISSNISDEEAAELLLHSGESIRKPVTQPTSNKWTHLESEGADVLQLDTTLSQLKTDEQMQDAFKVFGQEDLDQEMLQSIPSNEVIVLKWPPPLRYEFLRNMAPEISIVACVHCNKLFYSDELESQLIQYGHCAFCRKEINLFSRKS